MSRLGRVPEVGDEVTVGSNLTLRVDAMDGRRIDRIVVELSNASPARRAPKAPPRSSGGGVA